MSPIAFFFSASSTNTHCHPCELEPVGACSANSRHSVSTSRDTGLSKSRRLGTGGVVLRTSSTDRFSVICSRLSPVSASAAGRSGPRRRQTNVGTMTVELKQEVSSRLESDHYGWLTTVAKSEQPVPRLVWFYFDGTDPTVYSAPQAAKVAHIKAHPRVSLHLDSDGNGGGIIAIGGIANVDATEVDCPGARRH